ncbi:hypothetical protein LguiA_002227 [Lonicera macranthoides]
MAQVTTFDFRLRHSKRTAIPPDLMLELAETISLVCCQLDILKSKRQLKEEQEPKILISNIEKDLSKTNQSESKVANKSVRKLISKVNDLISKIFDTEFDAYDLKPEVLDLKSQVHDLRSEVPGLGSQIPDLTSQVSDLKAEVLYLKSQVRDLRSRSRNVNITTCFSVKFLTFRPRIPWFQHHKVFFYI